MTHCTEVFGKAALVFCAALYSTAGLAQSSTVSMKFHFVDVARDGRRPMKAMAGMRSSEVVAWLTPIGGSGPPTTHATTGGYRLVQKNKEFTPHLLVVPTGSSIDFPNEDPFFHNVFSLFNGKRFDLGLYEAGSHRSIRFDREGVSYIFCNIHPEMGAVIVSLSTPYYAISAKDGSVVLSNVPEGEYVLHVWAEGVEPNDLAAANRKIRLANDNVVLGTVSLGRSMSEAHKNKFGKDYEPSTTSSY